MLVDWIVYIQNTTIFQHNIVIPMKEYILPKSLNSLVLSCLASDVAATVKTVQSKHKMSNFNVLTTTVRPDP